jgi:DNA-binding NtrC family response regulator
VITRRRVLIIDEDRRTVDKLQEKFVQSGYEAEIALSGLVGLAIVAERYMSVAVLSAKVGHDLDWELVKSLKKSDPQLPVVLFNVPKIKGFSKEARRAGVSKFILSDLDAETVLHEAVKVMRN